MPVWPAAGSITQVRLRGWRGWIFHEYRWSVQYLGPLWIKSSVCRFTFCCLCFWGAGYIIIWHRAPARRGCIVGLQQRGRVGGYKFHPLRRLIWWYTSCRRITTWRTTFALLSRTFSSSCRGPARRGSIAKRCGILFVRRVAAKSTISCAPILLRFIALMAPAANAIFLPVLQASFSRRRVHAPRSSSVLHLLLLTVEHFLTYRPATALTHPVGTGPTFRHG